jgi:hypothetical protein
VDGQLRQLTEAVSRVPGAPAVLSEILKAVTENAYGELVLKFNAGRLMRMEMTRSTELRDR